MKFKGKLSGIILFMLLLFTGCDSELDQRTTLTFIGDSIIARWDLQNSFSSLITYNLGISGSGVIYIEEQAGKMAGRNVVVLTGTNDNKVFKDDELRHSYQQRYLDAITNMNADIIYLYEVLPRSFSSDDSVINEYIRKFNSEIARQIAGNDKIVYLRVFDDFLDSDGDLNWQYFYDGLHPNAEGYEILANALFDKL